MNVFIKNKFLIFLHEQYPGSFLVALGLQVAHQPSAEGTKQIKISQTWWKMHEQEEIGEQEQLKCQNICICHHLIVQIEIEKIICKKSI